ncbi:MAG: hypothetical protein ACRDP1_13790 [Nocardioidaceae bacterium]
MSESFEQNLRDLGRRAESAAHVADFDSLVRRGRARRVRRRAATSLGAIGVGVVAVVLAATVGGTPHSAQPVHPTLSTPTPTTHAPTYPPPRLPGFLLHHPVALVNQTDAHVVDLSYADHDHAAAVWEICSVPVRESCAQAVTWTSDGWRTSKAMVIPDKLQVYALPDGSTLVLASHIFLIEPNGTTRHVTVSRRPIAAAPGGPLTNLPSSNGANPGGMLDRTSATIHPPLSTPATRCVYDAQWDAHHRFWEYGAARCGDGSHTVTWTDDLGRSWSTYDTGNAAVLGLAVSADRTALLLGGTHRGDRNSFRSLAVTSDGGQPGTASTWPVAKSVAIPRQ